MADFTAEQEARLEEVYATERAAYEWAQSGDVEVSFVLRRQALALEEKIVGLDSDYLATSLDSFAIDLYNNKQYDEAETLFRRALEIYKSVTGPECLDVADDLQWLAYLYDDKKQYQKALQLLSCSMRLRRKNLGADYSQKAQTLRVYADLLRVTGRKIRATAVSKRADSLVSH